MSREYTLKQVIEINGLPDWVKPTHFSKWYGDNSLENKIVNPDLITKEGNLKNPPKLRKKNVPIKKEVPEGFVLFENILNEFKEKNNNKMNISAPQFLKFVYNISGEEVYNYCCIVGNRSYIDSKILNNHNLENTISFKDLKIKYGLKTSSERFKKTLNLPGDFFENKDNILYINPKYFGLVHQFNENELEPLTKYAEKKEYKRKTKSNPIKRNSINKIKKKKVVKKKKIKKKNKPEKNEQKYLINKDLEKTIKPIFDNLNKIKNEFKYLIKTYKNSINKYNDLQKEFESLIKQYINPDNKEIDLSLEKKYKNLIYRYAQLKTYQTAHIGNKIEKYSTPILKKLYIERKQRGIEKYDDEMNIKINSIENLVNIVKDPLRIKKYESNLLNQINILKEKIN